VAEEKQYGCPNCGSQDVAEQGIVPVEYTGVFFQNEDGKPEFETDESGAKVFWDCEEPDEYRYRCRECSQQFIDPAELSSRSVSKRTG
jgi:DNA-directed RNA polymerase subunit RPC12/RpoP